jgi:hypothetical protein
MQLSDAADLGSGDPRLQLLVSGAVDKHLGERLGQPADGIRHRAPGTGLLGQHLVVLVQRVGVREHERSHLPGLRNRRFRGLGTVGAHLDQEAAHDTVADLDAALDQPR